mgnify:CR=1 FL=1
MKYVEATDDDFFQRKDRTGGKHYTPKSTKYINIRQFQRYFSRA